MPYACQLAFWQFMLQAGCSDPEYSLGRVNDCKVGLAKKYQHEALDVQLKLAEEWVKHSLAQKEREDAIHAAYAAKKAADDDAKVKAATAWLEQSAAARASAAARFLLGDEVVDNASKVEVLLVKVPWGKFAMNGK
jgi:hypothetical protein